MIPGIAIVHAEHVPSPLSVGSTIPVRCRSHAWMRLIRAPRNGGAAEMDLQSRAAQISTITGFLQEIDEFAVFEMTPATGSERRPHVLRSPACRRE